MKEPGLQQHRRSWWRLLVGGLISLAFLWLAFRGVDWSRAWESIAHAHWGWIVLGQGALVLGIWCRAARWRLMFFPQHRRLRQSKFFSIFLVGQVINAVVPIRLGELARAYLIGRSEGVSKAQALWTVVIEKVLDSLTLLLFLLVMGFLVPLPPWLQKAAWALSGAILVGLGLLGVLLRLRRRTEHWLQTLEARRPWLGRLRLARLFAVVVESVRLVRRPELFGGLMAWSVGAFLIGALGNWLVAQAMGLGASYGACLLLLAVLQISAVVPIPTSPGRVGLFHYLCIISLAIFGIAREPALSYSLVLHALFYLPIAVGGPIGIWLESYRWRDLVRILQAEGKAPRV